MDKRMISELVAAYRATQHAKRKADDRVALMNASRWVEWGKKIGLGPKA